MYFSDFAQWSGAASKHFTIFNVIRVALTESPPRYVNDVITVAGRHYPDVARASSVADLATSVRVTETSGGAIKQCDVLRR